MPHIILIAEKPSDQHGTKAAQWASFSAAVARIEPPLKAARRLAENCWLLDLKSDLVALSELVQAAKGQALPYQAFLIEGELTKLS